MDNLSEYAKNASEMPLSYFQEKYGKSLKEHRCTCGRLLGKFSGRAEIKCPKCGKMNVIGGNRE